MNIKQVFNQLLSDIEAEETYSNKIALALDVDVVEITNTTSILNVHVIFDESVVINGSWEQAAIDIGDANYFPNLGCWFKEVEIFNSLFPEGDDIFGLYCSDNTDGSTCLSKFTTLDYLVDYEDAWLEGDINLANEIANIRVTDIFPPLPPGQAYEYPSSLLSINIMYTEFENNNNTLTQRLEFNTIFAKLDGPCY